MLEERLRECTAEQSVEVPVPRQEQTLEVAQDIPQELEQSHTAEQMVVVVEVTQLTPQERSFDRIAEQIADVNVPQNEEQNVNGVKVTPQEIVHCLSAKNMAKCPLPRSRRKLGTDSVCKNTVLSTRRKRRRQCTKLPCDSRVQCTTAKLQSMRCCHGDESRHSKNCVLCCHLCYRPSLSRLRRGGCMQPCSFSLSLFRCVCEVSQ